MTESDSTPNHGPQAGAENGRPVHLQLELYPPGGYHPTVIIHGQEMAITLVGDIDENAINLLVKATGHKDPGGVARIFEAAARLLRNPDYQAVWAAEAAARGWQADQ